MTYILEQGVAAFLRTKKRKLADTSYTEYKRVMDKVLEDLGGDTDVSELEPPIGKEIIEEFLDARWGEAPYAYNRNLSVVHGLIKDMVNNGHLNRDACALIERARPEKRRRTTYEEEDIKHIIQSAESPRDRVALRLLLFYGLRKGALTGLQMMCFDRARMMVSFRTKGGKYHTIPLAGNDIWTDIEMLDLSPERYLLHRHNQPFKPMSPHGIHLWWYARLADAGIVEPGVTSGQRMHKARHTAGQRLLDKTGNLKAAQTLLGHASIQTTGDVYTDWSASQLRDQLEDLSGDGY